MKQNIKHLIESIFSDVEFNDDELLKHWNQWLIDNINMELYEKALAEKKK